MSAINQVSSLRSQPVESLLSRASEPDEKVVRSRITGNAYVIAEIGHNHQGDLETAKKMFRIAKEAGADAVKLQKRENRKLYTKDMLIKPYDNRNSYGATYDEHREALEFNKIA